jgi:hypothetical protein
MKTNALLVLAAMLSTITLSAQDFQFTQFWNSPQVLNPALAHNPNHFGKGWSIRNNNEYQFVYDQMAQQLAFGHQLAVFQYSYFSYGVDAMIRYEADSWRQTKTALNFAYHQRLNRKKGMRASKHFLSIGLKAYYGRYGLKETYPENLLRHWRSILSLYYDYEDIPNLLDRLDWDLGLAYLFLSKREKHRLQIGLNIHHMNRAWDGIFGNLNGYTFNIRPYRYPSIQLDHRSELNRFLSIENQMNIIFQAVIQEMQFQSIVYYQTPRSALRLGLGLGTNFSLTSYNASLNNSLLETQASAHIKSGNFEGVIYYKHALSYSRYRFVYWEGDRLGLALNYNFIPIYSGGNPVF